MNPEALLQQLLPHWPGVLFCQRPDGCFEFVSARFEALTGRALEQWRQDPCLFWQLVHEEDSGWLKERIRQCAQARDGLASAFRIRHFDTGRVLHVREHRQALLDPSGAVVSYAGLWIDCTRQILLEKRLAAAGWKESLTAATLGFAHDFNNLLTGILSLSDAFMTRIDAQHPLCEGLALIMQNSRQASQLVQRLVHLHLDQPGTRSYQDLNTVVADTVALLRRMISRRIELASELDAAALPLYVDPVLLRQIIVSLALQAAEGLTDRGQILFRTSRHAQWPAGEETRPIARSKPAVCLAIGHNGPALNPSASAPAPAHPGAVPGLPQACQFAQKNAGLFTVEPQSTGGALFKLWLPEADFTEAEAAQAASGKRRCVLLVGPDEQQLAPLADSLRRAKFQVVIAGANPSELLLCDDYEFDVLLMQPGPADSQAAWLAGLVRKLKLPLKIVVRLHGPPGETLSPALRTRADMVLPPDLPADQIPEKLSSLWP